MILIKIFLNLSILLINYTILLCQENTESINTPKGFLVSVEELYEIRDNADRGIEPHHSNIFAFLNYIDSLLDVSEHLPALSGEVVVHNRSGRDPVQLSFDGVRLVYGTALAYHLTMDKKYAERCKGPIDFGHAWDHIIENTDITQTIELNSSEWDNTLIRNCKIHDTGEGNDGIVLQNVKNVSIEDCYIFNISGHGAIRLSNSGIGTDKVRIVSNTIYNVLRNGIVAPQRSQSNPAVNQDHLEIVGNTIYNTGLSSRRGLFHAIYCQAADHLIKDNRIFGERDGNGISVRSSGIISGNVVSGYSKANKPAIRYYSDHMKGVSNILVIENNIVWNDSTDAHCIDIFDHASLYQNSSGDAHVVKNFNIRFNTTITFKHNRHAIYISNDYGGSNYNKRVDGNIAINFQSENNAISVPGNTSVSGNYVGASLNNFVNSSAPYDFHITKNHAAVNYATRSTLNYPELDIDGDPRAANMIDAGADQISFITRRKHSDE